MEGVYLQKGKFCFRVLYIALPFGFEVQMLWERPEKLGLHRFSLPGPQLPFGL